jgi:hypothetical protein
MFQTLNEILYNSATKYGLDPTIISKLHQFISIFDSTNQSRHKVEILSALATSLPSLLNLFTTSLPQTHHLQCTYPIRAKFHKANPKDYIPVKEDYATLAWTILRYIRHLSVDKDTIVRTQALRTVRYWCINDLLIEAFTSLGMDYLIARSVEREHRYLDERLQGLKLIRHLMQVNHTYVTRPIIVTLLALSEQPKEEFRVVALDTLKDLLLTQPAVILGTTNARQILIDAILDPQLTEVSSPLTWSMLYLFDSPSTRHLFSPAHDFGRIFACYTDLTNTVVNTVEPIPNAPPILPTSPLLIKEKEAHRESAHRVLLTFMRSLAGLFALSSQPILLQSFVHMLSLPSRIPSVSWAKESVFEFFYDTLRIVTSYDLVTHKRALLNFTKHRNFLAHKQKQQLSLLSQFVDGLQYTTHYHNDSYGSNFLAIDDNFNEPEDKGSSQDYDNDFSLNRHHKPSNKTHSDDSDDSNTSCYDYDDDYYNDDDDDDDDDDGESDDDRNNNLHIAKFNQQIVYDPQVAFEQLHNTLDNDLLAEYDAPPPPPPPLTPSNNSYSDADDENYLPKRVPPIVTNFFQLRSQIVQDQSSTVSIRHVSLLHTYMVLVLTVCIRCGLLEHLAMLTLCENDDLAKPALKLLTEIVRLSCGLFPAQIATQLQTFPSLLQNAVVLNPSQNQVTTSVHQLWQTSIPTPTDPSLNALSTNFHSPHTTPQYINSLTTSPLKSIIESSNTSWALSHIERSSEASIRMQSLRVLANLFQENVRFLSLATTQDTFLTQHERQTAVSTQRSSSNNRGVEQIGESTDGISKTDFIEHGIDLSRLVLDTDQGSSRHSFVQTLPTPVTIISSYYSAEEALYHQHIDGSFDPGHSPSLGLATALAAASQSPPQGSVIPATPTGQSSPGLNPQVGLPTQLGQIPAIVGTGLINPALAGVNGVTAAISLAGAGSQTNISTSFPASGDSKVGPNAVLKGTRRPHAKSRELHSLYLQTQTQQTDPQVAMLLKQTNVLATKDQTQWDFNLILQILETVVLSRVHFLAALKTKFFKRLLSFLRPDKHFFTEMYLTVPHATLHAKVAAQLIRVILMYPEGRDYQFFVEFMDLIIDCLSEEAQRAESLVSSASLKIHPAHQAMQTHVCSQQPQQAVPSLAAADTDPTIIAANHAAATRAHFDSQMMVELGLVDGEIGSPMYQLNQGFYNYSETTKEGFFIGPGGTIISNTENQPEQSKLDNPTTSIKSPKKGLSSFFSGLREKKKDELSGKEDSLHQSRLTTKRTGGYDPEQSVLRVSLLKSPFEDDSRFQNGTPPPAGGYQSSHLLQNKESVSSSNQNGSGPNIGHGGDDFYGPRFRPFSHHNVIHRLCREYVTIFGILSSIPYGLTILLRYGFFDLIAPFGACVEYDYLSRLLLFSLDFTNITTTTLHSTSLLEYWVLHGSTFLRRSIASLLRTISRQNIEKFRYIGVELCIALSHSPDPQVSLNALALLEETCHLDPLCLDLVLKRAPDFTHFGQFVNNLYYSFLEKPEGARKLIDNGWLVEQLQVWHNRGCIEYVENSEYVLSLALSAHLDISAEDSTDSGITDTTLNPTTTLTNNTTASTNPTNNTNPNGKPNPTPQVTQPHLSPFLGNLPSLLPLLNPKTSIWSQYTLHQPQLWSTRMSIRKQHDDYFRQRLFQLPWNIEIVVETAQRRMVQLIVDTYVMEGFADSGTPVISDIMNANPYVATHFGLSSMVTKDSLDRYQEYEQDFKARCAAKANDSLSHTSTSQALSKQAMQQLNSLQNAPKPLLVSNDFEGASCLWVCANCLDAEGQPSPIEIDQYSILHSRLSPFILSTDLMPIGSSAVRHQPLDGTNLFSNLVPQDVTRTITSQYVDPVAKPTTNNNNNPSATTRDSPFHEIRKCYPYEREFHLLPSIYNIDNPTYIYNDENTQQNDHNWNGCTTFTDYTKTDVATLDLPQCLETQSLLLHAHDLDAVTPYFVQPAGVTNAEDVLYYEKSAVLTLPAPPTCEIYDSLVPFNDIIVDKPAAFESEEESTEQFYFTDHDESMPPPPPPIDGNAPEGQDEDSLQLVPPFGPTKDDDKRDYSTLSPRLPKYSHCSFYFLDGDVRWNFYRDPARPSKLYLTSVWYKISPSYDILPSVSVVPHLYGELSKTLTGCGLLYNSNILGSLTQVVLHQDDNSKQQQQKQLSPSRPNGVVSPALRLRGALWALALIGTSEYGSRFLIRHGLMAYLSNLALNSPVLSLRGTCFYLIGLLGLSRTGREHLNVLGWDCTEEDAQIASVGISIPRNMLSFLHVQPTTLAHGYPLQPMLSAPRGPIYGPNLEAVREVLLNPPNPTDQPIITIDESTGYKHIDIEDEIYTTYVYGLESVPISNLDATSERARLLDLDNQAILSHCEYELCGTPTSSAIKLILGHVSNLCNHVSQRSSLQTLRQWKQQYQLLFNSPILFAKVTQLLQMHTFGLPARRFIIFDLFGRVFAENGKIDVSPYMGILVDNVKPIVSISPELQESQQVAFQQAQQAQQAAQQQAQQQQRQNHFQHAQHGR